MTDLTFACQGVFFLYDNPVLKAIGFPGVFFNNLMLHVAFEWGEEIAMKRASVVTVLIISCCLIFPSWALALTTADLPGTGATLLIESDDTLVIPAGEIAVLGGTLAVKGTAVARPALRIENHGEFVIDDATLSAEQAALVIVNAADGLIRNNLDAGQNFQALESGFITIENAGMVQFAFTAEGGETNFVANDAGGRIRLTNSGAIDVANGRWTITCSNGGAFAFDQLSGEVRIANLAADTSSALDDADALTFTLSGGTFESGNLSLVALDSSLRFDNAAQCSLNTVNINQTATWRGVIVKNTGTMVINNLNSEAYGAGFLLDNRAQVEIFNCYMKSQYDEAGPYPALSIENRGDATLYNYTAVANGAQGVVKLINHDQLYVGNANFDGNYGGALQLCFFEGAVEINNLNADASGASHGKFSQVDMITAGGTTQINNSSLNNNLGITTILNLAETAFNNLTLKLTDGGLAKLGSQAGSLSVNNLNATLTGQSDENASALTLWNQAVLTINQQYLTCDSSASYSVPAIDTGTAQTFVSDCSTAVDNLAYEAAGPDPASGATGIEPASVELAWLGGDPDGDALTYDLYLAAESDAACLLCTVPLASGLTEPVYTVSDLEPGTTYAWQVVTNSGLAGGVPSPVWSFTTRDEPVTPEEEDPTSRAVDDDDDDDSGGCFCFITTAHI